MNLNFNFENNFENETIHGVDAKHVKLALLLGAYKKVQKKVKDYKDSNPDKKWGWRENDLCKKAWNIGSSFIANNSLINIAKNEEEIIGNISFEFQKLEREALEDGMDPETVKFILWS